MLYGNTASVVSITQISCKLLLIVYIDVLPVYVVVAYIYEHSYYNAWVAPPIAYSMKVFLHQLC